MKRLDSLTGVRFFAALLVFGFHSVSYANNQELDVFGAGMVGVSLFYILSGFVMAWTARDADRPSLFYRRRFARIYPAFVVAWILSVIILIGKNTLEWTDFVPPSLLQAWVPVESVYFAGSAVFWSLSCEAFFYLLFPILLRLIRGLSTTRLVLVGAIAVTISLLVAVIALPLPEDPFTRWLIIIFPPLRFLEFVVGVVLGLLFARGLRVPVPLSIAVAFAAVAVVAASFAPYSLSRYAVTLIPFIILVAALATADLQGRRSVLRWRPFVELGVWSYCFYLLHAMILAVSFPVLARLGLYSSRTGSLLFLAELIAVLALSVAAAWLLHIVVERPFERRLRPKSSSARLDNDPLSTLRDS